MTKKKILFFQHVSHLGGASWCLLEIIQELDHNLFTPVVILKTDGALRRALEDIGVTVKIVTEFPQISCANAAYRSLYRLCAWGELFSLRKQKAELQRICLELMPDIVYLNSITYFPIAVVAKRAGVKSVIIHNREHFRLSRLDLRRSFWRTVEKRYIDTIFSISYTGAKVAGVDDRALIIRDWPDFTTRGD